MILNHYVYMSRNHNKEIGQRLKKILIDELGLQQSKLAALLGYSSNSMLSRIFSGEKGATTKVLRRLHEEYNINLNYVLLGIGSHFINDQKTYIQEPSVPYESKTIDIYQVLADHERRLRMLEQQNQRTD